MNHWMKRLGLAATVAAALWGHGAAGAEVDIANATARQRYPWNGLVDIDCEVACGDPEADIEFSVSARDTATGREIPVRTVRFEGGGFGEPLVAKARDLPDGKIRLVWDADADAPGTVAEAVTVEVRAMAGAKEYLVVDLSAGNGDGAAYPAHFLDEAPAVLSLPYKTTNLVLRRIEPGTFTMGSPTNEVGRSYDETQHDVTLTHPFYIGVFEVTQKQYAQVAGSNPSQYTGNARPVEKVSYDMIRGSAAGTNWPANDDVDGESFLGKLRARASGFHWDLPTEAQWEYACRAGTATALNNGRSVTNDTWTTGGGDSSLDEVGRYGGNQNDGKGGQNQHTTVGSYLPNAWGLYDMHGTVAEWCLDWKEAGYSGLGPEPATDPKGASTGSCRMYRGGAWNRLPKYCRSAGYRNDISSPTTYDSIGFRLVCTPGGGAATAPFRMDLSA